LKRNNNQNDFLETLINFNQKIENLGKLNILSDHIYSENFFRDLVNLMYGYSLQNQNDIDKNAQAFDLVDDVNKIIIQVSSSCTKQKIENTLKKEVISKKEKENYRLKFLFIGKQNEKVKTFTYKNPFNIVFDPKKDILLTADLNKTFLDKNVMEQNEILDLVNNELSPIIYEDSLNYLKDDFIDEKVNFSISNLSTRYSEENDIDTVNNKVIEAISLSKDFKTQNTLFLRDIKNCLEKNRIDKLRTEEGVDFYQKFISKVESFRELIDLYLERPLDAKIEQYQEIYKMIHNIIEITDSYSVVENVKNKDDKELIIDFIKRIRNAVFNYSKYLQETNSESLLTPYILVQGRAGIGKSHLLAHITKKLREEKNITYLILGQFFKDNEDPWKQILSNLEINTTINKFLWSIDSKAKELNKRAFIIIDALNEGEGKMLWNNYFQSFMNWLKKYSNIAFIFSIRTPFEDIIIPKEIIESNKINTFKHQGFSEDSYEAIRSFCDFYELELPKFPILNAEYENPLFLKLACEYCKNKNKKLDHTLNISEIFDSVIKNVNLDLSKVNKLDYDLTINVVQKVIKEIIGLMSEAKYKKLKYMDVYNVTYRAAMQFVQRPEKFLESLIDENILSKINDFNGDTIVYFSYERMGDYYLSDFLLDSFVHFSDEDEKYNLIQKIKVDKNINKYFQYESSISINQGLIEELSIKLADEYDIELFEIFPDKKNNKNIIRAFINSLVWRTNTTMNETTKSFISENILPHKLYRESFLDVMLMKSSQIENPLNAKTLHKLLNKNKLTIRDYIWTQYISINNQNPFKIVNWLLNNYKNVNVESAELYMITLTWFFTSTNKKLRDTSTKALVKLFKEHPLLIIKTLRLFEDNDDAYVIERLYASVYGAVVRSKQSDIQIEIVKYIYNYVFDKDIIYPHILMRDYARQTIEYICLSFEIPTIELDKVRPPYKSEWYKKKYSNKEIDEFIKIKQVELDNDGKISIKRIVDSMTTEYGRGIGAYGDFGRYVFGHSVRKWMNQFKDDQELANLVTMRVFELGYDAKLHGKFDRFVSSFDRHNNSIERIGKKYQWIAFYELLARLADNFPTYHEEEVYNKEYYKLIEDKINVEVTILDDINEEDGNDEITLDILQDDFSGNIIDKKKYIEKVIKIPHQYSGPWIDYIRDIDPTMLLNKIEDGLYRLIQNPLPDTPTYDWVKGNEIFDDTDKYLEIDIDKKQYISLISSFDYENKLTGSGSKVRNSCYLYAMGYFYKKEKKDEILQNRAKNYGDGISVPEAHNVFLFEYFWSQSYQDYCKEIENNENDHRIFAVQKYMWHTDNSLNGQSISFYIPCEEIVEYFDLKQEVEGIWEDSNGEKVCINSKLLGYDNECLLIDKAKLFKFLKDTNYSIGWQVYLEKIYEKERQEWWYDVFYSNEEYLKNISYNECTKIEHQF